MKKQNLLLILTIAILAGIACVYAATETKFSSKFTKHFKDCENYQETIESEYEGNSFTTQRKIVGWSNGYCRYEEIVKHAGEAYKINCNFSEIQVDDLYTSMKDKSKEPITYNLETFAEQPDAKGSNRYKVVGSTVIKGNKAFITWAKYQNNPYFCRPEKIQ